MPRRLTAALVLLILIPATCLGQAAPRKFMPGDRLVIACSRLPWLCVTRVVQEDGRIDVPEVGSLSVATRTPEEVASSLESLLPANDRPAIEVRGISGSDGTIRISGAVNHPLEIRSRKGIGLSELLRLADPADTSDTDHLALSRADGAFLTVPSSYRIRLTGGDRVFVPVLSGSVDISVIGGVTNPSTVTYRKGITVGMVIDAAGGLAPRGDGSKVVLTRNGEPIPLSLPADASFPVQPGETVQVGVRADRRYVVVSGAVVHPGLVEYAPGMTLTQAVAAAGGELPTCDGTVTLSSGIGKRKKATKLSLSFIKAIRIPDPVLQPDDVLDLGQKAAKGDKGIGGSAKGLDLQAFKQSSKQAIQQYR